MTGVPIEKQAEYSVLLDDKVRELVRRHLKEALEDYNFMSSIANQYPMQNVLLNGAATNHSFINAVKQVMITQMNKY